MPPLRTQPLQPIISKSAKVVLGCVDKFKRTTARCFLPSNPPLGVLNPWGMTKMLPFAVRLVSDGDKQKLSLFIAPD